MFVQFLRPTRLLLILDFEIVRQGVVVDEILRTGEVYLQGNTADSSDTVRTPLIRVVVPDTKFAPLWEDLLVRTLTARGRTMGVSESHARHMAVESIRRWRTGPH